MLIRLLYNSCLKNMNLDMLGWYYRANSNSWMTGVLFEEFVAKFNTYLASALKSLNQSLSFVYNIFWFFAGTRPEGQKCLLLMDNASCHGLVHEKTYSRLNVRFLPPNMTSILQPCDAGIIRCFKAHYRRMFVQWLVEQYVPVLAPNQRCGSNNVVCIFRYKVSKAVDLKKFTVLEAMRLGNKAMSLVSADTIAHCWVHAGPTLSNVRARSTDAVLAVVAGICPPGWLHGARLAGDDGVQSAVMRLATILNEETPATLAIRGDAQIDASAFVDVDRQATTAQPVDMQAMAAEIRSEEAATEAADDNGSDVDDDPEPAPVISMTAAIEHLAQVQRQDINVPQHAISKFLSTGRSHA